MPVVAQASDLEKKESVDKEPIWRVLLHNDDVHTFDYVIDTIVKVLIYPCTENQGGGEKQTRTGKLRVFTPMCSMRLSHTSVTFASCSPAGCPHRD